MRDNSTPTERKRFAVLSTYDAPLLGYLLEHLRNYEAVPSALILDSSLMSARDQHIHAERTGGRLPWRPLHEYGASVPVFFVESHNDDSACLLIKSLGLDFLINGGTPRILTGPMLSSTRLGVINCHPGQLPQYRGCSCPEWAIFNDDPVCCTVHRMTAGIDEGPVLKIAPITFPRPCSYADMRVAVYVQSADVLARATRGLQDGSLNAASFVEQGAGRYHKPISDEGLRQVVRKLESGRYHPAAS